MFPDAKQVQPQFFGEPTINPDLPEMIKYAKQGGRYVAFYTNGSFPLDNADEVCKAKPDRIIFSVEADNFLLYSGIRTGLDWYRVYDTISYIIQTYPQIAYTVRMTACKENVKDLGRIVQFWKERVRHVVVAREIPKCATRTESYPATIKHCARPWQQLVIKADGRVVLCCVDHHAQYVIGRIQHGPGVWNNERFNKLRNQLNTESKPDICKLCGFNRQ